jgi:hypothetical protein
LKFFSSGGLPFPLFRFQFVVPAQVSFVSLIQCSIVSFCPSTNYPVFKDQKAFQTHSTSTHHNASTSG